MHEEIFLHDDTFAWVENILVSFFGLINFFFTITITPNPYPRSVFFFACLFFFKVKKKKIINN